MAHRSTQEVPYHDIHDRVPASIVKELRQGLRKGKFVLAFMVIQVAAVAGLVVDSSAPAGQAWTFPSSMMFLFLVMLPLSYFRACREDITSRNFELVAITDIGVAGQIQSKVGSIASLTGLLILSLLPYLLLHYFLPVVLYILSFPCLFQSIFY